MKLAETQASNAADSPRRRAETAPGSAAPRGRSGARPGWQRQGPRKRERESGRSGWQILLAKILEGLVSAVSKPTSLRFSIRQYSC